jgi:hypothetical protein
MRYPVFTLTLIRRDRLMVAKKLFMIGGSSRIGAGVIGLERPLLDPFSESCGVGERWMEPLPDDALVVRGGQNLPENFEKGSGVTVEAEGLLQGVSVNSAPGATLEELAAANPRTGYPGILNNQVGVTTVGAIRGYGGTVVPSPTRTNPRHATLGGLSPEQAGRLFRPTIPNPNRRKDN